MFDQQGHAHEYSYGDDERDKEVVDVEEPPLSVSARLISLPRVPTEDLVMHVQLDDGWHRASSDGTETACGPHIDVRLVIDTRPGRKLEHPLASCECWTTRERQKANDAYRARWGVDFVPSGAIPKVP